MIGDTRIMGDQTYGRGLEGLIAGETNIGKIDGTSGKLWYRGYTIQDLCQHSNFEEVSYLIIHGDLPKVAELKAWTDELIEWRQPPRDALSVLQWLPRDAHPLMKYRTMLSVAACLMPEGENNRLDAQWRRPARIMAWSSALAAAAIRHMSGEPPVPDDPSLDFSTNFLWQSLGQVPSKSASRAFEVSLIAQAEHGLYAAALAALTTISTGADLGSAVLAGMGALSGKKHGGANQDAFEMIDRLNSDAEAKTWVNSKLDERYRFPGFGHRVYKTHDPRLKIIEPLAHDLLEKTDNIQLWTRYQIIKNKIELQLGSKGVFANIDAVTGLIYYPVGLPIQSFPIPFALAIQVGWIAHCLEYIPTGKMIEPGSVYIGE